MLVDMFHQLVTVQTPPPSVSLYFNQQHRWESQQHSVTHRRVSGTENLMTDPCGMFCVYLFQVFSVCCRLSSELTLGEAEFSTEEHLWDTKSNRTSHTSALPVGPPESSLTSISYTSSYTQGLFEVLIRHHITQTVVPELKSKHTPVIWTGCLADRSLSLTICDLASPHSGHCWHKIHNTRLKVLPKGNWFNLV